MSDPETQKPVIKRSGPSVGHIVVIFVGVLVAIGAGAGLYLTQFESGKEHLQQIQTLIKNFDKVPITTTEAKTTEVKAEDKKKDEKDKKEDEEEVKIEVAVETGVADQPGAADKQVADTNATVQKEKTTLQAQLESLKATLAQHKKGLIIASITVTALIIIGVVAAVLMHQKLQAEQLLELEESARVAKEEADRALAAAQAGEVEKPFGVDTVKEKAEDIWNQYQTLIIPGLIIVGSLVVAGFIAYMAYQNFDALKTQFPSLLLRVRGTRGTINP